MALKYVKKSQDLITSHEAIRNGFLQQAITKGIHSKRHLLRAVEFQNALQKVKKIENLLGQIPDFKNELVASAGFSEKAFNHLSGPELEGIIEKALTTTLTEADFRQELVHRYLLTKGDTLGGSMRNIIGSSAGEKLVDLILQQLTKKKIKYEIVKSKAGKITGIKWPNRYLLFDQKPKIVGKNIDAILIDLTGSTTFTSEVFNDPKRYLACGELKGGIDPAGADEHWKTANSALDRIRTTFASQKKNPKLFFVGAAIEVSMASEIFAQIEEGKLSYVANLNYEDQIKDLVVWLTTL